MRTVPLEEIQAVVKIPDAIEAVRAGFIAHSEGRVQQPDPLQMLFNDANGVLLGDCHGKAAQASGLPYFVIKLATGFYNNEALGVPVNNGLVLVLSAESGVPIALLQDNGWLTQIRTAAAGALAAEFALVNKSSTLGIIGTGTQAALQAKVIASHLGLSNIAVYGRSTDKANALCDALSLQGLNAAAMHRTRDLCYASDIVVTTTPATSPVITKDDIPDSLHIIAVGADSLGKTEIDPAVMSLMDNIVTDSHDQCLHHGDFGTAVRAGVVANNADTAFSDLLARKSSGNDVALSGNSLFDLTGLGVQDLAIATLVVEALSL